MHFAEANGPLQETAKSTQGKLCSRRSVMAIRQATSVGGRKCYIQ